jgi:DNA-binding transcriptional ArsR family regulator
MPDQPQLLLDALSSPVRREILWLIWDRELPAGDIAAAFEVTAPTISQHLAVLRSADLVTMRVDGNFRRYRANPDAFQGLEALLTHTGRWSADDHPAAAHVATRLERVVIVSVAVDHPPEATFSCFVDPERYSRWLGVPVQIVDGRFSCETERGIQVRGVYDLVVPPSLLAMRWDFQAGAVPIPANLRPAYLRVSPTEQGSWVEVHQFVADDEGAADTRAAWTSVLTRLREGIGDAVSADAGP